ncbi:MAG: hypothetical protein RLY66_487 [Candidatus Parcubacteria bacterium]|jgi:hypothetical protein
MKVRISIGNIATRFLDTSNGKITHLAILNSGAWKKGDLLFGAIGGAAELTPTGRTYLEKTYRATDFYKNDARFIIDEQHLDMVMRFFQMRDPLFFEIEPLREIIEELTTTEFPTISERPGILPILTTSEALRFDIVYHRTVRQPIPKMGVGTSPLEQKDVPSRRLFHEFTMIGSQELLDKMLASKAVIALTESELASTQGGTCKGTTANGMAAIADNIGLL